MIITFTDRVGHKYCNQPSNRLDHQFPDILMVWNNNGVWTLENNGTAGSLTGTGVGNTQGPGGGEFFGNDYWVTQPAYHPEIALGSIYVLPGTGSVVTAAYDPAPILIRVECKDTALPMAVNWCKRIVHQTDHNLYLEKQPALVTS